MNTQPDPAAQLAKHIAGIPVAMMTTIADDGQLHSRPMSTQQQSDDGDLWFFANATTSVADNLRHHSAVNLSYVDSAAHRYVSVVGEGRLLRDVDRIKELWNPAFEMWFPKGINDPDLTLIQVTVKEADYWDAGTGTFVRISGFIRQLLGEELRPNLTRGHLDLP